MIQARPSVALTVPASLSSPRSAWGAVAATERPPARVVRRGSPSTPAHRCPAAGRSRTRRTQTNGGTPSAGAGGSGSSSGGSGSGLGTGGGKSGGGGQTNAKVSETDIYRVSGSTLYYLDTYRGLMIFDISNADQPKLVGRAPVFGDPQEMFVQGSLAVIVLGDWYGTNPDGSPFYGSLVEGDDCTDPTNLKNVGSAYLRGYVQDTRVVGDVLYTVAQDYGWEYGWDYGWGYYGGYGGGAVAAAGSRRRAPRGTGLGSSTRPGRAWSSALVSFAGGKVQKVSEQGVAPAYHFTQLVWKSSKKIGCSWSANQCSDSLGTYYLYCEFSPQGNIAGQFAANVTP